MIKSIEIENFKSIKSKYFPLRNLNILLGLNGQGKSSFIQTLLLLRQSRFHIDRGYVLLKGDYTNIGSAKDALYQYTKDPISIDFTFSDDHQLPYVFDYDADSDVMKFKSGNTTTKEGLEKYALINNDFQYLNADRIEPTSFHKKSSSAVSMDRSIGMRGEYTVHFLETHGDDEIAFTNCIHEDTPFYETNKKEKVQNASLRNQVQLWLGEVSPEVRMDIESKSSDVVELAISFTQPNLGTTNKFKPQNVGFGISYALHVVTALLSAQPGGLIIIENPESHIHPRGQAELGKLIALVAQNDVQVIIETHSDHILNGIRVGVKEEKLDKDKAILFYFKKIVEEEEQYSSVINIEMDRNGTLSDYPENLLDEWNTQLSKLI